MNKIGFIGMGNMGYAILKGCLSSFGKDEITYTRKNIDKLEAIKEETGIDYVTSNIDVVKQSKYIVLAIKPQMFDDVAEEIKDYIDDSKVVISLAPGVTIASLKNKFGGKIVRTMPNTPAMVNAGMTGVCVEKDALDEEELNTVNQIFSSFGKMKFVDESLMDAVVCASGSSPAYVFMFMDALANSCAELGLDIDDAREMVAQTVYGSAKLMMETHTDPETLRNNVCSKGGTTIEGVNKLIENNFYDAINEATKACKKRCEELTK